jgi:hypothetical protein
MRSAAVGVVLGAITLLALKRPMSMLLAGRGADPYDAAVVDARLGPIRHHLTPGVRVHYLVRSGAPNAEIAMYCLARYALAPAVVMPVKLRECQTGVECGLGATGLFATDSPEPELLRMLATDYGLHPVFAGPGAVLLAREP